MEPWGIVFFQDADGTIPGDEFMTSCPDRVEAKIVAVLDAVAAAPPPSFSGGGFWEAMHGDMGGMYEIRVPGPRRNLYRLFCILDRHPPGLDGSVVAVITGMVKRERTTFTSREYRTVKKLGDAYLASAPRSIAT